jgi:diadenosine tetraphosphatase ApaH/serine/threonine PP2A family protein phosphatase
MRVAILTDIHANREALDAVLADVKRLAPDDIVILGDLVGYGPDPDYVVDRIAEMAAAGRCCILGNHDEAAAGTIRGMREGARRSLQWTKSHISEAHRHFLGTLPPTKREDDRLYVHASAHQPARWHYLDGVEAAQRCLASTDASIVICGHTHVPAVFFGLPERRPVFFKPLDGIEVPLSPLRRYVLVVGSVGQPRDGNPAACFAILDTTARTFTIVRTPYDWEPTMRKIKANGLPSWHAMRLKVGR